MRVLWDVIKSSLASCSVNRAFSSEHSFGSCADPCKLTWRFIQLFSKGPRSWAYSQEGELVFQWISLSIWKQSGLNMALAKGRPWVMNSFVFSHLEDQMLEAVKTFTRAKETISFSCHRWWILWVYSPFFRRPHTEEGHGVSGLLFAVRAAVYQTCGHHSSHSHLNLLPVYWARKRESN